METFVSELLSVLNTVAISLYGLYKAWKTWKGNK